jgi:CheY-like chemotaxis protein
MNILFLDDDEQRIAAFQKRITDAKIARTAKEMIDLLTANEIVDLLFLDHDLGGEIYVKSDREDCGMEVVRWIVANKPKLGSVFVHSHNEPAAIEMVAKLMDAGYSANWMPFSSLIGRIVVGNKHD